jgi:hypothetical protein
MIKKFSSLVSLILIATLFSCTTSNPDPSSTPSTITATIDGQSWASINGGAIANVQSIDVNGEDIMVLQIIGVKMDQSSVSMQFPIDNLAVGTYTFSSDSGGALTYSSPSATNIYTSSQNTGAFTIAITDLNLATGTFSGTFSGTLFDFNGDSIAITNGELNTITYMNSQLYSNGFMSLSKNGGAIFTMDDSESDAKYLMISENSFTNSVSLFGNNANLDADFGVYSLTFPKDVTPGTYNLMTNSDFDAGISNSETQAEFNLTSGTATITSHNGNNVVGTFSFNASNGNETVTITNGSFNVTHN